MGDDRKKFADDLDSKDHKPKNETGSDINQYETVHDKWNKIQEEYLQKYPELDAEDLFFEGGGFERVLEKISEIRGNSIEDVRTEILNWQQ